MVCSKHVGRTANWTNPAIGFSPNPVECVWVGPSVSDLNCSGCVLGYETESADNNTCVKPDFRPHKGWGTTSDHPELRIQDALGKVVDEVMSTEAGTNITTNTAILTTGRTYKIPPPELEPKERRYSGYKQPYTKIRYELDFSRGAEVCCRAWGMV